VDAPGPALLAGQQDRLVDSEHGVGASILRHVTDRPCALGAARDGDRARPAQQPGNAAEERRLAGGVRADHRDDLARREARRGHAGHREPPAMIGTDPVEAERHHERLTFERMSEKKNGTPTRAVMMPIGKTTPGRIDLLTIEVSDRSSAPQSSAPGRKKRWSSPRIMRATCGPTRPMKPIVPTKLTGTAARSATTSMIS